MDKESKPIGHCAGIQCFQSFDAMSGKYFKADFYAERFTKEVAILN